MVTAELPGEDFTLDVNEIIVGRDVREPAWNFHGNFLNFYFDGERLFDRYPSNSPATPSTDRPIPTPTPPTFEPTDPITLPPGLIHHILISVNQIGADARIRFWFRTRDDNGVLLYTSRDGGRSFLGVELVDGQLVAVSDSGSGPRYVRRPPGSPSLADGQWHELDITRAGPHHFIVRVDGHELPHRLHYPTLPPTDYEQIYIGGVPLALMERLPSAMRSRKGYSGCMATLVINGQSYNLQSMITGSRMTVGCRYSKHSSSL